MQVEADLEHGLRRKLPDSAFSRSLEEADSKDTVDRIWSIVSSGLANKMA